MVLHAAEVSFVYPQAENGLSPVSVSLAAGQTMLVGGPSGCGKSTLARCLTGLIPHLYHGRFRGEVLLNGQRTTDLDLWRLAETAGMVFQNPASQMLAPSVEDEIIFGLENLGLPGAEVCDRTEEVLQRFSLGPLRRRAPQTLSGGEQQKLALAAITARRPGALVLDEPLSMLDSTAALEFVAHTQDLAAGGAAVLFCEHRHDYLSHLSNLHTLNLGGNRTGPNGWHPASSLPLPGRAPFHLHLQDVGVVLAGRPILQNLNLDLPGRKTVALVGRNGVGKTTLFRAIAGLQKYQGAIEVHTAGSAQTPQMGMVFQNPDLQLFNASVKEEILYRLDAPDTNLYHWVMRALDLERYEQVPPLLLSEGEKRRVVLATMLMRTPGHGLLLDEPALGQDEGHKATLLQILRTCAAAGYLVVFSTHDLELALQADHLVLLGSAGIAAQGSPAEIMHRLDVWRNLGFVIPEWIKSQWPV